MQLDYKQLLEEITEITTVDGFVSACLEIKDSMFFYERDLMLAAFSASLELLIVAALFSASLQGKRELAKVELAVKECVDNLLADLNMFNLPLDIQFIADRYLEDAGLRTSLRLPVYLKMMHNYAFAENQKGSLDNILLEAHTVLSQGGDQSEAQLDALLAQAGTMMLRGAHLRPIWLQISHPRIYFILIGFQTMMSNFKVTPYFNFPLEDITTERQKRKKIRGNVVLDLSVFRNFRQGGSGYTDLNLVVANDEYDHLLDDILADLDFAKIEPNAILIDLLVMILQIRLNNGSVEDQLVLQVLAYCEYWNISQIIPVMLELLEGMDPEDSLFFYLWKDLHTYAGKALPAIRSFVRANPQSSLLSYIAVFLATTSPGKRKWDLLLEIFENYPEADQTKIQIAGAIARFKGEEVVPYLEQTLTTDEALADATYRAGLQEALEYARANP